MRPGQAPELLRTSTYVGVELSRTLLDNPLLRVPLELEHTKPRLLGHWGTTPGLNFVYAHLNRLEGTYTHIGHNEEGLRRLFRQFSWPLGPY